MSSMEFKSKEEYYNWIELQSTLPDGFKVGTETIYFVPKELPGSDPMKMDLSLVAMEEPTSSFAAVFTKNKFPGYPVIIGKQLLAEKKVSGFICNNKISNVRCPGGYETAKEVLSSLSGELCNSLAPIFPFSTGIIGWKLPRNEIVDALPNLCKSLSTKKPERLANAIMTTDGFPKARTVKIGNGRITGFCKGAGMIEPNMATMLVYLLTDIKISRKELRSLWGEVCNKSFNSITIDGDQSTSDSALILSSNRVDGVSVEKFKVELTKLAILMAQDLVRNGEGTSHVIEVEVVGAETESQAKEAGKSLLNSPLTKTAIFGNDPNVGRFIQALGDWAGNNSIDLDPEKCSISMGGESLYENGYFTLNSNKEVKLHNYMNSCQLSREPLGYPKHQKNVIIKISLGLGNCCSTVYGSDLTYEYIRENAEYRT